MNPKTDSVAASKPGHTPPNQALNMMAQKSADAIGACVPSLIYQFCKRDRRYDRHDGDGVTQCRRWIVVPQWRLRH